RIDKEAIDRHTILDRALAAIDDIVGDDLELIVGSVGEGAPTIDVAHGPDALHAGAQVIVDRDIAARIGLDAGSLEIEAGSIGGAAHGQEEMAALHGGSALA